MSDEITSVLLSNQLLLTFLYTTFPRLQNNISTEFLYTFIPLNPPKVARMGKAPICLCIIWLHIKMHVKTQAAGCEKDKEEMKCRKRAQLHAL